MAYCAGRASKATNTGLKPKPASARTRNSRMSGGTLAKEVSSNSMLPSQVPAFSRTEFGIPEIGRIGFHAEQWIVGPFATVTGIVTNAGILLSPEHRNHGAVQIENQSRSPAGQVDESLQQSVVDAMHLFPERVRSVE